MAKDEDPIFCPRCGDDVMAIDPYCYTCGCQLRSEDKFRQKVST